jgi:gliding motility-associated-like protein
MAVFTYEHDTKSVAVPIGRLNWLRMLLFSCLFAFLPTLVQASHNVGADISYRCLGNNQYEITLNYYRDCNGIGSPTTVNFNVNSPSNCGAALTNVLATQTANSGREVSQLCPALLPQSTCGNGTLPGVEVYTYVATITLPSECADWTVSYSDCCRNAGVTNLVNGGAGIYVETIINNTNGLCNSSPVFTTLPVPYICSGQPFSFNHGAIDVDGDSLVFSIIEPRDAGNAILAYGAGFSIAAPLATAPANTFGFNTATGQMTFTPNGAQLAVVAVLVIEYRNGVEIGRTMRDIQIVVLNNCTNLATVPPNAPVVNAGGSYDPATSSFVVCAGEQLIFSFGVRDPDATDTLAIYTPNTNLLQVFGPGNFNIVTQYPIPGRFDTMDVFVIVNASAQNLGANQFTIGLTDNACPVPSTPIIGFNVIIPGVQVLASDTTICPGIAQDIELTARTFSSALSTVPGTYLWQQISGPAATTSDPTLSSITVGVPATTVNGDALTFQVTFTTQPDPNNPTAFCITTDSVTIRTLALPLSVNTNISDTTFCQNGTITPANLTTTVSGPGIDTVNGVYTWTSIPASAVSMLTATNIANPIANMTGTPGLAVSYIVQYAYGACVGTDTVSARFNNGVVQLPAGPIALCTGDSVQITATLSDTNIIRLPVICTDYSVTAIPHAPLTGGTPTNVTLTDDSFTGNLPIGFSFGFMCDTFTQFRISSNGFITFDLATADNGCCSGEILPAGPPGFTTNSMIALAWNDLNPGSGGTISYTTIGTAPNRRLLVNFTAVPHFGGGGAPLTGQIVLYEGTNIIDIFTTSITNDGSTMTQGIQNDGGTAGVGAPGRNGVDWSAANSGYRFEPLIALITPPISYAWSPSATLTNDTINNPFAFPTTNTMYTVSISEDGCVMTDSVLVQIETTLPAPVISCGTAANPSFELQYQWGMVAGATGWEYSLDSGATYIAVPLADSSLVVTGLQPGDCILIYVRAVGGVGACTRNAAASFECCTYACNPNTSITEVITTSTSCPISNGSIDIQAVQNLTAPFTYAWSEASIGNTPTATGLMGGTYFVTITDVDGCPHRDTFVVGTTTVFIGSFSQQNPSCGISNGSITVNANGGATPYTYVWSSNAGGQTTNTATGLAPGVYSVTTTDANGCRANGTSFINGNEVTASIIDGSDSICFNASNGFIDAQATTNGPGTISYIWSNGATTQDISNVVAGVYTLTASVPSGTATCTSVATFTITSPATDFVTNLTITTPLDCSGEPIGVVASSVAGSWGNYAFAWSNGATTADLSGLAGGTYTLLVTDAIGCTASVSSTLIQPQAVKLNAFILTPGTITTSVLENTLNIPISAGFNEPGVSYTWTPNTNIADPNVAVTTVDALTGGTFVYVVRAASIDCELTDTVTLEVLATSFLGMPTAFTPNGDGENDFYVPVEVSGITIVQFRIYNRWGQLVYDNAQLGQQGWDGTVNGQAQPRDVYMYVFEYRIPTESENRIIRGEFTLIR